MVAENTDTGMVSPCAFNPNPPPPGSVVYPLKNGDPSDRTTQLVDRAIDAFKAVVETRLTGIDRATMLVASDLVSATAETDLAAQRMQGHITRDIEKLAELIEANLNTVGARITGMDTATKLLAESVTKFPSDVDRAVQSATDLILSKLRGVEGVSEEKFNGIKSTFESNALALTAALAAQKEAAAEAKKSSDLAIDKSEKTTQETIRANDAKTASGISAQAAVMTDLKDRLIRLESGGVATAAAHTEGRASSTYDQTDRIADLAQANAKVVGTRMTINTVVASVSALVAVIAVIFAIVHK
jgi:hypothetical protein